MATRSVLLATLFVFWTTTLVGVDASIDLQHNETQKLFRRQCEWNSREGQYSICDLQLPTITQIFQRMYDTGNKGLVDDQRHAVFYTNLDDPNLSPSGNDKVAWFHGWLQKEGLPYYWIWQALDNECKS